MPKGVYERKRTPLIFRFMERVSPPDANGCRLFRLAKGARYGRLDIGNQEFIGAHVASAIAFYGPVPEGMQVLHKCDVPACVNPAHLFFGTQKDNIQDCITKGRREQVGRIPRKLTAEDIRAIRFIEAPLNFIAEIYDINISAVSSIKNRRRGYWEWLP